VLAFFVKVHRCNTVEGGGCCSLVSL
jgi:hypothetical protein